MSTPLSLDLRVRVLAAVAAGLSHRQAGERFGVSAASVSRWQAQEHGSGSSPRVRGTLFKEVFVPLRDFRCQRAHRRCSFVPVPAD